ncbi:protein SPMIP3 [Rhineura floridana]|uniref:protein SPMIP3 n=1 Tax=Rhineura floridana TaxID=261503 RepID=UPI002AC87397|nr:protein SPMIP3 [Rhineura floridana]
MAGSAIKLRQFVDSAPELPSGIIHHQGKDVLGYYPGQLARLHFEYPPEGQSRPFTKLQPVPVKHDIVPQHDYDYLILKQYIHYQRTKKKIHDWYTQTTYKEAFTLPFYKSDSADSYRPRTDAELLSVWKSPSAKKKDKTKPSFMGV